MKQKHQFGFEEVSAEEKTKKVTQVFQKVAQKYDLMNDLMSFGLHRFWKRLAASYAPTHPHARVLDVACGSGDLALLWAQKSFVVAADINFDMLAVAKEKSLNKGRLFPFVQCDAENLPFGSGSFDVVSCAFGLRNMTHKEKFLQASHRVLVRGGRLIILEFSEPAPWLKKFYDYYSFHVIPWLGEKIAHDRASYQYLVESIRVHPHQEKLRQLILDAQFNKVYYHNILSGIVALHVAIK